MRRLPRLAGAVPAAASPLSDAARVASRVTDELWAVRTCARAGMLGIEPPQRLAAVARAARRYGPLGGAVAIAAIRRPDHPGIIDERGTLTFAELDRRSNALANAWRARGLNAGDGVAILARNHRGFLDATFAAAKAGARAIYLNTDFAGPQIREVAAREGTDLLVYDDEYAPMLEGVEPPLGRWRAWADDAAAPDTLDALIATGDPSPPPAPERPASVVILTSGTTGTPKGAPRPTPKSLVPIAALLSVVPFRGGEATIIGAPMFHALGFAHMALAVGLGSTTIVRRRFDPAATIDDIEHHRATALIAVPVMLQRLLALDPELRARHRVSSLRIIFAGGSQLGAELCQRTMDAFGPVVYNLYGSTEVAYATIANPRDLQAAPACVGPPARGAVVKLLDADGREVPQGETGRIFVGNAMAFEGYTGGGTKEMIGGLMSTGDVGHFDAAGRLFIDGRDDEMIVSGGENVFPREIEELLARHKGISDAAAIGVPDEQWGQRLRAFVVRAGTGNGLDEDAVKAYVRENLARYKVPREVLFIDELPRNPSGKILKRELAALEVS